MTSTWLLRVVGTGCLLVSSRRLRNKESDSDEAEPAGEIDRLLKSQLSTTYQTGVIEVWYDPGAQHVQVITYASLQGWV